MRTVISSDYWDYVVDTDAVPSRFEQILQSCAQNISKENNLHTPYDDDEPLKLCDLCSTLKPELTEPKYKKHHPTFRALVNSAEAGCGLCGLFLEALLCNNATKNSRSIAEAVLFHLQIDEYERKTDGVGDNFFEYGFGDYQNAVITDPPREAIAVLGFVRHMGHRQSFHGAIDPFSYMPLTAPDYGAALSEDFIAGREITLNPELSVAQTWMTDCSINHTQCQHNKQLATLPTRVIDVGPSYGSAQPRLVVSSGQQAAYVALTHRWGNSRPLTTTAATLQDHLKKIPLEQMPLTFRDAVTVTRRLQIRYLWIDSLCILQDSEQDWQRECAKMETVYSNAIITIAASWAEDSNSGFLGARPKMQSQRHLWEYRPGVDASPRQLYIRSYNHSDWEKNGPFAESSLLTKRAWVLQEQLLSPRVLYFGSLQMYWECDTYQRFEKLHFPRGKEDTWSPMKDRLFCNMSTGREKLFDWLGIVENYMKRELTEPTDRLPALSGIARKMWAENETDYLAGLLRSHLQYSLLWETFYWWDVTTSETSAYIAPSWSWASSRYPVGHRSIESDEEIAGGPPTMDLKFLDASIQLAGSDPFGKIRSGYLKVCSKTRQGRIVAINETSRMENYYRGRKGFAVCNQDSLEPIARFLPDSPPDWLPSEGTEEPAPPMRNTRSAKLARSSASSKKRTRDSEDARQDDSLESEVVVIENVLCLLVMSGQEWCALAIERTSPSSRTYRRVGLVETSYRENNSALTLHNTKFDNDWFNDAKEQTIKLV